MKTIFRLFITGLIFGLCLNFMGVNRSNYKFKLAETKVWVKNYFTNGIESHSISISEALNPESEARLTSVFWNLEQELPPEHSVVLNYKKDELTSESNSSVYTSELTYSRENKSEASYDWIKEKTQEYSPESWSLLMLYDLLPQKSEASTVAGATISSYKSVGTFHYLENKSKMDMLSSMATNVHEICHAYFFQNVFKYANDEKIKLDWKMVQGFLYLSHEESYFISFPKEKLFPSSKLARKIPAELRTFRFDTYIEGNTSTQSEGIIGLLDELNAYYQGARNAFEMLEAYKIAADSDLQGLFEWVSNAQSEMCAYYEFDFFIREYLLYMKAYLSSQYADLKSYKTFGKAYLAVCKSYNELIENYQSVLEAEISNLNSLDKNNAWIENNYLWVKTNTDIGYAKQGTSVFSSDRDKLIPVLKSERYVNIFNDFID